MNRLKTALINLIAGLSLLILIFAGISHLKCENDPCEHQTWIQKHLQIKH